MDDLTNGLLEGKITQVYGEFATGKTTYCLQAAVRASETGKKTIYVDTENGFSPERAMQIGGRDVLRDLMIYYPRDLQDQTRTIVNLEGNIGDSVGLIVVDSLVSLYKVDAKDLESRTELIYEISLQLLVLSRIAREAGIPVLVTNHVYEDIEAKRTAPVGGHTVKYWSKVILEFTKEADSIRAARLVRHPYLPEKRCCKFRLTNEGIGNNDKIYK